MISKAIFLSRRQKVIQSILIVCSALLLAIWPLPGTIVLRHILLVAGFLSAIEMMRAQKCLPNRFEFWPVWLIFGFFAWILFHLLFLSSNFSEQIGEFTGLWLRAFMASIMAYGLGLTVSQSRCLKSANQIELDRDWCTNALILGFGGTVIIFFVRYLYEVYLTKSWLHFDFYMTPYAGKPPVVVFGAIFFTLLLICLKKLIVGGQTWTRSITYIVGLFLVIFAEYFANTKNGVVILLVPLSIFSISLVFSYQWNLRKAIVAIIVLIPITLSIGYVAQKHIEANSAWPMLIEDIKMGADIDNFDSWKDAVAFPYPKNSKGVTVNNSTYERSAWAVAASRLIKENPLGYGLIHHSFGALAIQKWPDFHEPIGRVRGASHSGLLDFTLGVGIPGLLLVLIPFGVAFYRAANQDYFWMQFVRWGAPVLLAAYLITEVSNNHFIEFLFFMISFCVGLTAFPSNYLLKPHHE